MGKYQDLIVFQKADNLAFQVYGITDSFPKAERSGASTVRFNLRSSALTICAEHLMPSFTLTILRSYVLSPPLFFLD